MEYVMVPVPEEIADQVLEFVQWGVQVRALPLEDPGPLLGVIAETDVHTRQLLSLLADATLEMETTTLGEAAERIGITTREVVGLGWELNFKVTQAGGSPYTIVFPITSVDNYDERPLVMGAATAKAIEHAADLVED